MIEADDRETGDAGRSACPGRGDRDQPHNRTKPKALNAGLAFARGTFAVFDAEDRDFNQLRCTDVFSKVATWSYMPSSPSTI